MASMILAGIPLVSLVALPSAYPLTTLLFGVVSIVMGAIAWCFDARPICVLGSALAGCELVLLASIYYFGIVYVW